MRPRIVRAAPRRHRHVRRNGALAAAPVIPHRARSEARRCIDCTTTCPPATATKCGCCSRSSAFRSSWSSSTSSRARRARGVPREQSQRPHPDAGDRAGRLPGRVERHPLLPRRRDAVPPRRPPGARAGPAVDVLRAVQPRAQHRDRALLGQPRPTDAGAPRPAREKRALGYAALDVMERHLSTRPFFVGERYSIADIALYAYTHVADEGGFDLDRVCAARRLRCASRNER